MYFLYKYKYRSNINHNSLEHCNMTQYDFEYY